MERLFDSFANTVARIAGSPAAFLVCVAVVVVWAVAGPFFGFSETWQLVINTGTTIVTFLMVFLIQSEAGSARQTGGQPAGMRIRKSPTVSGAGQNYKD